MRFPLVAYYDCIKGKDSTGSSGGSSGGDGFPKMSFTDKVIISTVAIVGLVIAGVAIYSYGQSHKKITIDTQGGGGSSISPMGIDQVATNLTQPTKSTKEVVYKDKSSLGKTLEKDALLAAKAIPKVAV